MRFTALFVPFFFLGSAVVEAENHFFSMGFDIPPPHEKDACDVRVLETVMERVKGRANLVLAKHGVNPIGWTGEKALAGQQHDDRHHRELPNYCAQCNYACPYNYPLCFYVYQCCTNNPECSNGACERRRSLFEDDATTSSITQKRNLLKTLPEVEERIKAIIRKRIDRVAARKKTTPECAAALKDAVPRAEIKLIDE